MNYTLLGASTDRVITVRVKNALALAKGQSALASIASGVPGAGPDFVEGQAYEAIAQKIGEALALQKADAEVKVIDGSSIVPKPQTYFLARNPIPATAGETKNDTWKFVGTYKWGMIAGVGLSAVLGLAWHYFSKESA